MRPRDISPCLAIPHIQGMVVIHRYARHCGQWCNWHCQRDLFQSCMGMLVCMVQNGQQVGMLTGDVLMELLGTMDAPSLPLPSSSSTSPSGSPAQWSVSQAIFLTDVDGVFAANPRTNPDVELLRTIPIDAETGAIIMQKCEGLATTTMSSLDAAASAHEHDITVDLKVRYIYARQKNRCLLRPQPKNHFWY